MRNARNTLLSIQHHIVKQIKEPAYFVFIPERFRLWIVCLLLVMTGCGSVPVVHPYTGAVESTAITSKEAESAWARVLKSAVNDQGQIDFKKVAASPGDLNRFLSYIERVEFVSEPPGLGNRDESLAFFINSYNALALSGVIYKEYPESFDSILDRAEFFTLMTFKVGKKSISLYNYENRLIRAFKEPRIHFVLNCMVKSCPRLPRTPITAKNLNEQLDRYAKEFFNSKKHVEVDTKNKTVYFSKILDFYTDDFVNDEQSSSLIAYANRYRADPIDETFDVKFIPYDWTVNYQKHS